LNGREHQSFTINKNGNKDKTTGRDATAQLAESTTIIRGYNSTIIFSNY
jgi:hypothetical protein